MILTHLKAYGFAALAAVCAALLLAQSLRLHAEQRAHGDLKTLVARQAQAQAGGVVKEAGQNTLARQGLMQVPGLG